jgi:hypothetical protein
MLIVNPFQRAWHLGVGVSTPRALANAKPCAALLQANVL